MVLDTKTKWVIGGVLATVVVISAAIMVNPELQHGYLNFGNRFSAPRQNLLPPLININQLKPAPPRQNPPVTPVQEMRAAGFPDCLNSSDYEIRVLYSPGSNPNPGAGAARRTSIIDVKRENGKMVLGEFAIVPRFCQIRLDNIKLSWSGIYEGAYPNRDILVQDPSVRIWKGNALTSTPMVPHYYCLASRTTVHAHQFDASTPLTITPVSPPVSFVVSGIPFGWSGDNQHRDRPGNDAVNYSLELESVNDQLLLNAPATHTTYINFRRGDPEFRPDLVSSCIRES